MHNTQDIPSSVPARTNRRWRIADGKFVTGSDKDGSLEFREPQQITGRVKAFRIFEGVGKETGKPFCQLEVDLVTAGGPDYIKVNKNMQYDTWPSQGVGLAKYLASLHPDGSQIVVIEAERSKKPNAHGTYNTFVNVDLYNPEAGRREMFQTEWDGEKFTDIVNDVFGALEKHPLYQERKAEEEKSEFDFFQDALDAKGFNPYLGHEAAWLAVFNAWLDADGSDQIASVDPDDPDDADYWTYFRQKLADATADPTAAKKAPAPKKGPAPKVASPQPDDYDPFADE